VAWFTDEKSQGSTADNHVQTDAQGFGVDSGKTLAAFTTVA
jgi:hypothetical protein